eukprot:2458259-Rhodomonas_salina.1
MATALKMELHYGSELEDEDIMADLHEDEKPDACESGEAEKPATDKPVPPSQDKKPTSKAKRKSPTQDSSSEAPKKRRKPPTQKRTKENATSATKKPEDKPEDKPKDKPEVIVHEMESALDQA